MRRNESTTAEYCIVKVRGHDQRVQEIFWHGVFGLTWSGKKRKTRT
jgi:hypothetical protein